jgi:glycosyltransferase involved in cell wall biosynthesis
MSTAMPSSQKTKDEACPKKIMLFVTSMACGGAERVAILLASAMTRRGHTVWIVLAQQNGEFLQFVTTNIKIINLNCRKPIRGTAALGYVIKDLNPDAIIAFGISAGIAAAVSKTRCKWKSQLIIRNESNLSIEWSQDRLHNKIIGPALSRWAAQNAKIIAVSHELKIPTARFLKLQAHQVTVIPNPVFSEFPLTEKLNAPLHSWLTDSISPTFVAMGRLEHQKGFDTLISAFSLVRSQIDARLIIFGNGKLREALQEQIMLLGLSGSVDLPGFTNSPISQMQFASAFVLSSRWEGFGLVLVEALAAGTKVVSTNCDYGPSEILEGGRYGTLVPVDDAQALANAMIMAASGQSTLARPSTEWYTQFTADEAAKGHLELI